MTSPAVDLTTGRAPIDARLFEPRIIPADWTFLPAGSNQFVRVFFNRSRAARGLFVLFSVASERDSRRWIHVSASHRDRLPSWDELRDVKRVFIGDSCKAIQVLPPEDEYINLHPYVLHLWSCVDADVVPDFRVWNPIAERAEI